MYTLLLSPFLSSSIKAFCSAPKGEDLWENIQAIGTGGDDGEYLRAFYEKQAGQ